MKNKNFVIALFLVLVALSVGIFQYVKVFQSEIASAYNASKHVNGHSWSEMQCTNGFCVTTDNKVGIGTDMPSDKLNVVGNVGVTGTITATADVCNGAGACLSQISSYIGSTALVNNQHNYAACTAEGGTVVDSDVSFK